MRPSPAGLLVGVAVMAWAALFMGLALARHANGGTHAEDLGFTDQVIWNLLHGQGFRFSVYDGATWNTELDLQRVAQPDSLLAFHVEPLLLAFVPLYAMGGDARSLLVAQAVAVALGAAVVYGLGLCRTGHRSIGLGLAAAYLLCPLSQWLVLADFHTTAFAAPLLLLAVERIAAGHPRTALVAVALALGAREDVGPVVAVLGVTLLLRHWRLGGLLLALGGGWTLVCLVIINQHSGGASPLAVRYSWLLTTPGGPLAALVRSDVQDYLRTLLLSGGWLGLLAPLALLPALPALALNALSDSPWMATGKAHYSALVLPFLLVGATEGLRQGLHLALLVRQQQTLARWSWLGSAEFRWGPAMAAIALVMTSLASYLLAGAGPLATNYAPPEDPVAREQVLQRAVALIPPRASLSASAALAPHVSHRSRLYVFPAVLDADFVLLDVTASPAPTSAGDVFLHVRTLLRTGDWRVAMAENGVLLLQRAPAGQALSPDTLPSAFYAFAHELPERSAPLTPVAWSFLGGAIDLVAGAVLPSAAGAVGPDGPQGTLRTVWRLNGPLPEPARVVFYLTMDDGVEVPAGDGAAALWWYPVERWQPGETVQIDLPSIPLRRVTAWRAAVEPRPPG